MYLNAIEKIENEHKKRKATVDILTTNVKKMLK